MSTAWIYDRPPTHTDTGNHQHVWAWSPFEGGCAVSYAYSAIPSGRPWAPGHHPAPTTAPEPMHESLPPAPPEPIAEPIDAEFFPPTEEIPEPIRTGACPFYVLVVSDEAGGKPGGNPIVWEHTIPKTTTLQGALRQQLLAGSRYGTTYLAECRIIPETIRHAE
jgi:hypothetical protein